MKGMVKYSPGPAIRLNVPSRNTITCSHCEAMRTVIIARAAATKPMHSIQMFISHAMTKPSAVTAMKVMANTKAENTLGALSST